MLSTMVAYRVTTVKFPTDLHRRLQHHAIDAGQTQTELIIEAVREYLDRIETPQRKEAEAA